jgi:SH3-like domain-containing protein
MSAKILLPFVVLALVAMACEWQIPRDPVEIANTSTVAPVVPTLPPSRLPTLTPSQLPTLGSVGSGQAAKIITPVVNVHSGPDLNSRVDHWLSAGDPVVILETRGNWVRIQDPSGWIWRGCTDNNPDQLGCEAR